MKGYRLGIAASLLSAGALSCAAAGSDADGYVLLDQEARQAGVSIEVDRHAVDSPLPVAVTAEQQVVLHHGATEEPVTVNRGELVYVEGATGRLTHLRLGKEVAPDALRLTGEEGAANELAGQLGTKVAPDGAGWRLQTPGVFTAAALAHAPERLMSAAPVMLGETEVVPRAAGAALRPPTAAGTPAPSQGSAVSAGLEVAAAATPRAGSSPPVVFGPAVSCPGVAGKWRGRAYSEKHEAYYDFTLTVSQTGSALKGTVVAEFWDAATDDVEPPGACAQSKQHVKVVEGAAGTVEADGTMRFASTSWHVGSHLCGERVTSYSADRFVVPHADGSASASATASDEAMWVDGMPVDLTRVSCR